MYVRILNIGRNINEILIREKIKYIVKFFNVIGEYGIWWGRMIWDDWNILDWESEGYE